jgi:hypothetical protein
MVPKLPLGHAGRCDLAQRIVEMLVGRLLTDDTFRAAFLSDPEHTLLAFCARGFELNTTEMVALLTTDRAVWADAAERLDSRLRKASLEQPTNARKERERHV